MHFKQIGFNQHAASLFLMSHCHNPALIPSLSQNVQALVPFDIFLQVLEDKAFTFHKNINELSNLISFLKAVTDLKGCNILSSTQQQ